MRQSYALCPFLLYRSRTARSRHSPIARLIRTFNEMRHCLNNLLRPGRMDEQATLARFGNLPAER